MGLLRLIGLMSPIGPIGPIGLIGGRKLGAEEAGDEVWAAYTPQALLYASPLLRFVPEEILPLRQLVALGSCTEDRLHSVRVVAGVPHFGGHGHGRWSEVLHLL